jgi:methionyl-tRNA formyltransferase
MIKICFFFNGKRGLDIYSYLKKKKFLKIQKIFLSRKFLNKDILSKLQNYTIIDGLHSKIVKKNLFTTDISIVGGFPYIFPKALTEIPKLGTINCHAGILPKYRGGSPLNWQIINGEKKFGITTIKMNKGIDQGKIIKEKNFFLKKDYDINDLHNIVNKNFPKLVFESIKKLSLGEKLKKQPISRSYFKQRTAKDSLIKFEKYTFKEINNYIRALKKPYPEAYFIYKKKKIIIKKIFKCKRTIKSRKILKIKNKYYVNCKDCVIKI